MYRGKGFGLTVYDYGSFVSVTIFVYSYVAIFLLFEMFRKFFYLIFVIYNKLVYFSAQSHSAAITTDICENNHL